MNIHDSASAGKPARGCGSACFIRVSTLAQPLLTIKPTFTIRAYLLLAMRADQRRRVAISHKELAAELGCCIETVARAMKRLSSDLVRVLRHGEGRESGIYEVPHLITRHPGHNHVAGCQRFIKILRPALPCLLRTSGGSLKFYLALGVFANREMRCHPSIATIARVAKLHPSTVAECQGELVSIGLLHVRSPVGNRRSNEYELVAPSVRHGTPAAMTSGGHQPRQVTLLSPDCRPIQTDRMDQNELRTDAKAHAVAVQALQQKGIDSSLAAALVEGFGAEHVEQKLFLADKRAPGIICKSGWMIRAITRDYKLSPAELAEYERRQRRRAASLDELTLNGSFFERLSEATLEAALEGFEWWSLPPDVNLRAKYLLKIRDRARLATDPIIGPFRTRLRKRIEQVVPSEEMHVSAAS